MNIYQENLITLIKAGTSPFHVVREGKKRLEKHGFTCLEPREKWSLQRGEKYYLSCYDTTLIAFTVGENPAESLRLAAAHTDFPCLRVKPSPETADKGYGRINIEPYGSIIRHTWLDTPLSLAGKVVLKGAAPFAPETVYIDPKKALFIIPEAAIHMNRDVNESASFNMQKEMLPLMTLTGEDTASTYFINYLASLCEAESDDVLAYDLNLYPLSEAVFMGLHDEFIGAPRLDNLTSVSACLSGITEADTAGIRMALFFDNEEVGSTTKQGAASMIVPDLLKRIYENLGFDREEYSRQCAGAFLLSMDAAHAYHPNYPEKNDITNFPLLNGGVVLKQAANQTYAGDAEAVAAIKGLADSLGIKRQSFVNRSDMRGGSTLGSLLSANVPVRTADIGIPLLSMHSSFETMGADDQEYLTGLATAFLSR